MVWVSTRWLKLRQRGIAQFLSISIVFSIGFMCTVSSNGGALSSNRASIPERLAFAGDTSFSAKRIRTIPDATDTECPDPKAGNTLGPGTADSDLVVAGGTCMVNSGTYMYRNINIIKGGTLQFSDPAIILYAANIIIQDNGTIRAGTV